MSHDEEIRIFVKREAAFFIINRLQFSTLTQIHSSVKHPKLVFCNTGTLIYWDVSHGPDSVRQAEGVSYKTTV
jgi:hypothetical protein